MHKLYMIYRNISQFSVLKEMFFTLVCWQKRKSVLQDLSGYAKRDDLALKAFS